MNKFKPRTKMQSRATSLSVKKAMVTENLDWLMDLPKGVLVIEARSSEEAWVLKFEKPGYMDDVKKRLQIL